MPRYLAADLVCCFKKGYVDASIADKAHIELAEPIEQNEVIPEKDSTLIKYHIRKVSFLIMDRPNSCSAPWIAGELAADQYRLERIAFCPGDIVIDVGAHVGMFSIYLAKRFPFLSIFAFEPEPTNFNNLLNNLGLNRISNVVPRNIALTKDSRPFSLIAPIHNSGGASGFFDSATPGVNTVASSETLESVFESNRIEKCKLLKMDCEGAEHEVLFEHEKPIEGGMAFD